jgi:hypothetical protein
MQNFSAENSPNVNSLTLAKDFRLVLVHQTALAVRVHPLNPTANPVKEHCWKHKIVENCEND